MLNIFRSIITFLSKFRKNKENFTFAKPPHDNSSNNKFKIGDSVKLKNELDELANKNEILTKNSKKYINEKSNAGKKRHQKTEIIKNQIIKPMFDNKELIKSTSIKQRADKIEKELVTIFSYENDEKLRNFAKKYNLEVNPKFCNNF